MKFSLIRTHLPHIVAGICFGFLACLLFTSHAEAVPAEPSWRTFQQPKGSSLSGFQFTGRAQGDEWLDWYETKAGKIFLRNPKTGGYEYAVLKDGGSGKKSVTQLGLSGILVGTLSVKPPEVSFDDVVRMWEDLRLLEGVEFPLNEQEPRPPKWRFPTLIILVNFTDFQALGPSHYQQKVFGAEPFTVNHYYAEVSRGLVQFDPAPEGQGTANDGVVTVQLDYDNPAPNLVSGGDQRLRGELRKSTLLDALTLVDEYVDFAHFDLDSDGGLSHNELQLIFVWANPRGQWKVWPHVSFFQNVEEAQWDGVRVADYDDEGRYVVMNESGLSGYEPLGTYVHELGHSAFGLRDQYDAPRSIGKWGLMGAGVNLGDPPGSQPAHMLGASKVMAGFIEPTVVLPKSTGGTFALPPHQSRWYDVIKIPTAVQEYYYILENRRAEGTYDSALLPPEWPPRPDHGLLISLVDDVGRNFIQDANLNPHPNGYLDLNLFSLEGNHTFGLDTQPASRTPAEADGFAREATGLRVNLEREDGDLLVVSVALGREFVCQEYTSTNPVHVDNDRAYTGQVRGDSGWEEKYYAAGSEDDLGLSRTQLITLIEGQSGDYSLGSCGPPVVREVYPPRLEQLVLLPNELIWPRELDRVVQFSADVSDPEKDIARVDFRLDNGPWQAGHAELEWEGDWGEGEVVRFYYNVPPADVPAGSHEVQVRAFDVEGHMSDIVSYAFELEP